MLLSDGCGREGHLVLSGGGRPKFHYAVDTAAVYQCLGKKQGPPGASYGVCGKESWTAEMPGHFKNYERPQHLLSSCSSDILFSMVGAPRQGWRKHAIQEGGHGTNVELPSFLCQREEETLQGQGGVGA